ncbi:MAG TPA: acetate/propionate family kinase [Gaiellaceae bacterium]
MSRILVVNAGSTSLKLSIVDEAGTSRQIDSFEQAEDEVDAVAHRVVHGGARFSDPVVLDAGVRAALDELTELAPLHNRPALVAIGEAMTILPDIPHIAVFDTAFHRTIPAEASTYALPSRWRDEWGIRRFGFQGLSVQWSAEQVRVPRLVVCHLGGGCSVTAVRDGRSVDTTMGFSPLEGVPMATRSGSIDTEIVLHLLRTGKLDVDEIEDALQTESGLLGLSGETAQVEELERSSSPGAELALGVFAHRVAAAVAAMTVSLDGIDALVFTAGIGEGSASVRRDVCRRLRFLGVELDEDANAALVAGTGADIAAAGAGVRIVVVHAREDVVAARAAANMLG